MSEPKGYTNIITIENYLLTTIKEYFKSQVEEWIVQTEDFIEDITGRVFIADEVATYRKFELDRNYSEEIWFDECVEVEELKYDGEVVDEENYYIYPANSIPKNRIKLEGSVYTVRSSPNLSLGGNYFYKGNQNIGVKAKWGYSVEVPGDIKTAATAIVAGIITFAGKKDIPGGVEKETIGPYSLVFSNPKGWADTTNVDRILNKYTKVT